MPFKYACFISYPHGQHTVMKPFIEQLTELLEGFLEPYMDEEVYKDDRLKPGYKYNESLAEALCHSICMIVVYSPVYEDRVYCLREYATMEKIEEDRFKLMGQALPADHGMIIPIILRGSDDLPDHIKGNIHFVDFSQFMLEETTINRPEYRKKIEDIAKHIHELRKKFKLIGQDPCGDCPGYKITPEAGLKPWRGKSAISRSSTADPFPLREEGR